MAGRPRNRDFVQNRAKLCSRSKQRDSLVCGYREGFLPLVRQKEREAVHSPQYSTELNIQWVYVSTVEMLQWTMLQRMLQRTVFTNKIKMLQRKWINTIGRCSTRVRMTSRAFLMLFMCVRLFMLFIRESLFLVFTRER